jgi:hypothetical protein
MDGSLPRMTLSLALAAALAACAAAALGAAPAQATKIAGGSTTLMLDRGFAASLKQAKVKVGAEAPAAVHGRRVDLDVSSGDLQLASARGSLKHGGILYFLTARKRALLRDLTLTSSAITADVGDLDGLQVANLDRSPAKTKRRTSTGSVTSAGIVATLTEIGADELNRILRVSAFRAGARLGVVKIEADRALKITGGSATLTVAGPFNAKLAETKFLLSAAAPATGDNVKSFAFPVTSGSIGAHTLSGSFRLSGGVVVDQEGPFITLKDPIVKADGPRSELTIIAGPFGRVVVADIDLTRAKVARRIGAAGGTITLTGVPVRFSPLAATALTLVGIPTLKGQLLGRSDVTLRVAAAG